MFDLNSLVTKHFNWKTALSLALASDLAYQRSDAVQNVAKRNWHLDHCAFFDVGSTQCFLASTDSAIVISFRGTESLNDWLANLNVWGIDTSYGRVHRGFLKAFELVRTALLEKARPLRPAQKVVHLTGHSLGGALATIAACTLRDEFPTARVYTFGQPRVGDATTAQFIKDHYADDFYRFVFDDDIVPRVPPGYVHVGRLFHFDANGFLQKSAVEGGDGSTEPPPLTLLEFEHLKHTAQAIEVESWAAAALGMEESQDELADRSLEGIFPSVRDHRMSRYIFAIRNQLARSDLRPVNESEMDEALNAFEAVAPRREVGLVDTYPVQVRVRDLGWSPPLGVIVNSQVGPIYSLLANRQAIRQMTHDKMIFSLNLSREIDPRPVAECAVSVPFVHADAIHSGNLNEKGDCAIVGLIDTGIDILHEAFLDDQGNSRIEAVWVQKDTSGLSPMKTDPKTFSQNYGTLYTHQQIQKFVNDDLVNKKNTTPSLLRDPGRLPGGEGGHGTHVASIAAGRAVGTFGGGMAPEARIVVVVPYLKTSPGNAPSLGYSNSHQDALAFLQTFHQHRGLPMAVNVSLGMNAGAHDGTSDSEKVFDSITQNGKIEGFVVVKSAGNERGHSGHTQVQASVGVITEIKWDSAMTQRDNDYLEFWYHADDELKFTLIPPSKQRSPQITHTKTSATFHDAGNDVHLRLTLHVSDNDDNRLVVEIIPVGAAIQVGIWTLEIEGVAFGPANGRVDGWVERNDDRPVLFMTDRNDDITLSIPGTADTVVCVAASNTSNPLRLYTNSSYGPTRSNGPKPDVNAPGEEITAARSNSVDHQAVVTKTGTSMAAPHVTGAMALVLSARHKKVLADGTKKQFNATNLAGMLRRSANHYNKLHNKGTGFGSLNALNFFKEADLA